MKPYAATLERLLSAAKATETEGKNAIKFIAKYNQKIDKKVEYTEGTNQEPTLSSRMLAFKSIFESVRALKEMSITSGKSGSISADDLSAAIHRVQNAVAKLEPEGPMLGFPLLWVQAVFWYGSRWRGQTCR